MAFSHLFEGEGVVGLRETIKKLWQRRCFLHPLSPETSKTCLRISPAKGERKNTPAAGNVQH
jgi:hypothetical protein